MKFASFTTQAGAATWGAAADGLLYDLGPSGTGLAATLSDAIRDGKLDGTMDLAHVPGIAESSVSFLPLVTAPGKILCVGVNYRTHQQETGRDAAAAPTIFARFADTLIGHEQPTISPSNSTQFDYEGEVALVIGRPTHRITEDEAMASVAGYGLFNDFTVRDWQRATSQWMPGKNFPATGAFGPYFVPSSEIENLAEMRLQTRVNGEVRQSASLSDLVFTIPELVAYASGFTPLKAGDVIVTGTPGGVGLFRTPSGLLSDGDVVEVEATGLGVLRNTVQREPVESGRA